MAVIELGEPEPEPPVREEWRPRPLLCAVLALLTLFAVTGSARPRPPAGGDLLWSAPSGLDDLVSLDGDTVYQQRTGEQSDLVLYDLATGARRWSTSDAVFDRFLAAGPVLLLIAERQAGRSDGVVTARGTADGRTLWQRPGTALAQDRGVALLAGYDADGRAVRLSQVRLTDGVPVWSRAVAPADDVQVEYRTDGTPGRIVAAVDGRIDLYRWADGTLDSSGRLPIRALDIVFAYDGRLQTSSGAEFRFFDLGDFRDLGDFGGATVAQVVPCATLICRIGAGGAVAIDPATGREVWQHPEANGIDLATTGRVLLTDPDGLTRTLADATTGRVLASRVPGTIARAYLAEPGSVLLLHATRSPDRRTAAIRLDLATGAWRLLGLLPPIADPHSCTTAGSVLLCQDNDRMFALAVPG
ncbi:outer membrane protein assembly factor BamB [Actinoplanes octamycinicus]|uniref:Outer membrane protein assembly factor BamB n=1 Tax=Actinoplanes octamycinicus TaxID=135948 RepID=A0A7W7GRZ7_9ACTN|nr:PQQ-binding-like beta-propeller repeat protein [Actinoplanes octamycinicus]MBB4737185.1 outer membrane protein assembly factor BamB [Actinoplanes octamycinicus]GIE61995.1 hypothetical protein Aoc01nite_73970 [Actinoplanes octamycinicus]